MIEHGDSDDAINFPGWRRCWVRILLDRGIGEETPEVAKVSYLHQKGSVVILEVSRWMPMKVKEEYQFPGWQVLEEKFKECPVEIQDFLESLADDVQNNEPDTSIQEQIMSLVGRV